MQELNLQLAPAAIKVIRRVDQSSRLLHAPRGRRGRTVYGVRQTDSEGDSVVREAVASR